MQQPDTTFLAFFRSGKLSFEFGEQRVQYGYTMLLCVRQNSLWTLVRT